MFVPMAKLKPREQGDIGELSAMEWLASRGAHIYVPVGHSPDIDLVAEIDGVVLRIEVKTATHQISSGNWDVHIATRGGNQSWNGVAKYFDRDRCDFLFVHVGDGRRWFIPSGAIDARTGLTLGGHKYSEYEVESGRPIGEALDNETSPLDLPAAGGVSKWSKDGGCKPSGLCPSQVRLLPPPLASSRPVQPTNYERKPGQRGEAVINQKRRITIPQRPFFEAGFADSGKVRVRADGPGRIVIEQIELPPWARDPAGPERRAPE
jgi:Holliday junction resolvase-like predicted endonuclease